MSDSVRPRADSPPGSPVPGILQARTLDPLGVPSRMNLGQVLEVHLGAAVRDLGWKIATPVFDGATEEDIESMLEMAGLETSGKTTLYDGRTGEAFDKPVTVGVMYKQHHKLQVPKPPSHQIFVHRIELYLQVVVV